MVALARHRVGARHVYSDRELASLARMLEDARPDDGSAAYVMFNNIPRAGDAKRFLRLLTRKRAP